MQSPHVRSVHGPFSSAFLERRLPETDEWDAIDEADCRETFDELRRRWERVRESTATDAIEERFVRPAFRTLGLSAVPVESTGPPRSRPDYALLAGDDGVERTARAAGQIRDDSDAVASAVPDTAAAIADVRSWDRDLDGRGAAGDDRPAENPSHRLHVAVQENDVRWGMLTNGRRWRLYDASTSGRLDSYYEVDLPAILEADDREAFRYVYYFFRGVAFRPDADGDCVLDRAADRSAAHAQTLRNDLRETVAEAVAVVAEGFLASPDTALERDDLDEADRELLFEASLTAVYRSLIGVVLERERARSRATERTDGGGLRSCMRSIALGSGASARSDESPDSGDGDGTDAWARLEDRLERSAGVSSSRSVDERSSPSSCFLAAHGVRDDTLSHALDLLARRDGDEREPFVPASLDVRDLGRVYERLLEARLEIADEPLALADGEYVPADGAAVAVDRGEPYLTADGSHRKTSGSYYTPPSIVEYVVDRTVGPLLSEIRADLADHDPGTDAPFADRVADRVFDLAVLDPAMGSGRFLTAVVDALTRELVAARERQARERGLESLAPERGVDWARRRVAQHCVYGVDRRPLAVELATASLRLRTLTADRPPVTLEGHLRAGNALVGSDRDPFGTGAPGRDDPVDWTDATVDLSAPVRDRIALEADPPAAPAELAAGVRSFERDPCCRRLEAIANVRTARAFGLECVPDDAVDRLLAALDGDGDGAWDRLAQTDWFSAAQRAAAADGFLHWRLAFPEQFADPSGRPLADPGFDAVVGNPPWVATAGRADISASLESALRSYLADAFVTTENQFDLYVACYERAVRLSKDGRVGFVVPDSILTREGNAPIREFLLTNAPPSTIVRLGAAFDGVETGAALVVSGGDRSGDATVRCADATDGGDLDALSYESIPVSVFESQDAARFRIYLDAETRRVLSSLEERPALESFIEISRGEEIGKRADSLADSPGTDRRPIAPGAAIRRYGLDADELRYIDPADVAKAQRQYASPKLLLRQTGDALVAAYDADDLATIKSVYNVRLESGSAAELKHLLGVLHSSVLAFYHHYKHAAYRAVFPQLNQSTVESLPVPMADAPDPALVAAVDERRSLTAERSALPLALPDYLDEYRAGPSVGDLSIVRRADGVAATDLAATTTDRPTLKLGSVVVDDGATLQLSATVRYKPDDDAVDTDRWGYTETDPIPALEVTDPNDDWAALLAAFVPHAISTNHGTAGCRRDATKTISPLDRLESLSLPRLEDVADELAAYREARERAAALDARLETLDRRIDERVETLYGLSEAEREIVRREFGSE
ncbi:restriction endonuclease [Natrinema saccharevitans]|uniref:site-specific DNA-methyltransferase (adenine-specific) n=1 Tax=Natrinema saccharevitans TaxID=301967 RepID=A0A1S8AY80_9EURY|nr:TaqI-like C-terminal specificity domain-containing protein [Natrinema saccharevitans]OLZ41516.1 restriction endonuclease [Natrinema saccharevitans]